MLTLENVEFAFSPLVAWNFSFHAETGKTLAIAGKSGVGKSTLLNLITGFYTPFSGKIVFNDQILNELAPGERPISMLFQENNLFEHLSVKQNVALGIHSGLKLSTLEWKSVFDLLAKVGLNDKSDQLPDKLSGGQRQRVALARCLLRKKPLLLLDEPFTALDSKNRADLIGLIQEFQRVEGITILLVTHHDETIAMADRCIELESRHCEAAH